MRSCTGFSIIISNTHHSPFKTNSSNINIQRWKIKPINLLKAQGILVFLLVTVSKSFPTDAWEFCTKQSIKCQNDVNDIILMSLILSNLYSFICNPGHNVLEFCNISEKFGFPTRSLLNCVPCVLKTCSRANVTCVLTYSRVLRSHVPTCLACSPVLCAHVPTCLACLRAKVSCVLMCSRTNVSWVLTCSRADVPWVLKCSHINVPSSITLIYT